MVTTAFNFPESTSFVMAFKDSAFISLTMKAAPYTMLLRIRLSRRLRRLLEMVLFFLLARVSRMS